MEVVTSQLVSRKKVLLRYDIDVPLSEVGNQKSEVRVAEDFRLKAGLPTVKLCLDHAQRTTIIGHIGRPKGFDESLSVKPIVGWLEDELGKLGYLGVLESGKLKILENLRFDIREDREDLGFAKELAADNDFFVNEAFAAHHPAASTTILPTLFTPVKDHEGCLRPRRAAGIRFAEEVKVLGEVREKPRRPLVAIIGGVKLEDKLPAVKALSQIADAVLVGGKIAPEWTKHDAIVHLNGNVLSGKLNDQGSDLAEETVLSWQRLINGAKMVVWNGPLGEIEDPKNDATAKVAQMVINSGAETIVGGGDTITYLNKLGLLDKFSFVSTGGGAMLKFLTEGTLPTIEALNQ